MESKQIRGRRIDKPARRPSVNMLTMADIIQGVNAILNPGKEPVNWFAPAADAVAAVHVRDGKANIDNPGVLCGGDVTDKEVAGLKVVAYDGREGGIYAEGAATDVTVDGAYISLAGDGEGIGGPASGAAAKYGAKLTLRDAVITTTGRTRYSTAAEEGSVLKVYDSVIWSHGIPYGENIPAPKEAVLIKSHNALVDLTQVDIASEAGVLVHTIVNDDPCATKVTEPPYGVNVRMADMTVSGDLLHEDTTRDMWVELKSTTLTGAIKGANLSMDAGSKWIASADSDITLLTDVDPAQIDAPAGVTVTVRGGEAAEYTLAGGGRLVVEA